MDYRRKQPALRMNRELYLTLQAILDEPSRSDLPQDYIRQFLGHCREIDGEGYVEVRGLLERDLREVEEILRRKGS